MVELFSFKKSAIDAKYAFSFWLFSESIILSFSMICSSSFILFDVDLYVLVTLRRDLESLELLIQFERFLCCILLMSYLVCLWCWL